MPQGTDSVCVASEKEVASWVLRLVQQPALVQSKADDDDELMLNVLRCHLTY